MQRLLYTNSVSAETVFQRRIAESEMTIDIYQQYFEASCVFNGIQRRAASVKLTSESGDGEISYTVSVSFFPHTDDEDFAVSYDAYAEKMIYQAKGRRSKKREAAMLQNLRQDCDALAGLLSGVIVWNHPIRDARYA